MIKPVKVLCFYRYWARVAGVSCNFKDSIIISTYTSRDIARFFYVEMSRRLKDKKNYFKSGPRPIVYELEYYLPENGKKTFNRFRDII